MPLVLRLQRVGVRTAALHRHVAPYSPAGSASLTCATQDFAQLHDAVVEHVAAASPFMAAGDAIQSEAAQFRMLSTGIDEVNAMLDGGLRSGEIVELAGVSSAGKTQASDATPTVTDASVLYMDTSGSFYATRVHDFLASSASLRQQIPDLASVLSRIQCVQCFGIFDAIKYLETLHPADGADGSETHRPLSLIIIDSVGHLLSPIVGQGGHNTVATFAELLASLAKTLWIPIVVNSSVSAGFQDNNQEAFDPDLIPTTAGSRETMTKPALGAMWDAVPTYRLFFTTSQTDGRAALYRVYLDSTQHKHRQPDDVDDARDTQQLPNGRIVASVENRIELLDGPYRSVGAAAG
ncbi:P-loop containing nucleoside triphosphate hydrolase protein [Entophlyctis helioformis]|nr:P-loop containing nucleoside triphosphate hydrolase protein [Entophlyctis helioformis]